MKLVPFKSIASALRMAAGVAACIAFTSGEAWSQGQRWQTTLEKLRSLSVNDPLPAFAKQGQPIRLIPGYGYLVTSNRTEIPATLFSAVDCKMSPGNRDIDCTDRPQTPSAVVAVLAVTKWPDRRGRVLPAALMLVPPGPTLGSSLQSKDLRTLTPGNAQGPLIEDKFFWIAIDGHQDPRLAPAGVVFCLDECDSNGPLYTLSEALPGEIGQGATAGNAERSTRQSPSAPQLPPSEITVTVRNIPSQYTDKIVARLVLSAVKMRDGTSSSDIISITPATPAGASQQKAVLLKVKGNAIDGLTVAGEKSDCLANPKCDINLTLRPRYVDTAASNAPRLIASVRPGDEAPDPFYKRLNLNNIELPKITQGAPPGYSIVYLLDDSYFQIYFKIGRTIVEGRSAPSVEVPRWDEERNLLRLSLPTGPQVSPTIVAADDAGLPPIASTGPNPGGGQAPPTLTGPPAVSAPGATAAQEEEQKRLEASRKREEEQKRQEVLRKQEEEQKRQEVLQRQIEEQRQTAPTSAPEPAVPLHYVLKPALDSVPPGWTEARLARRLVELLRGTQFSLKEGEIQTWSSQPQSDLTPSSDAVIVWSGNKPQATSEWRSSRPVDGVTITPPVQAPQTAPVAYVRPGWRIRANDTVAIGEFRIDRPYLYDQWQASIEALRKVNGQEVPDSSNELCSFSLSFNGSNEPIRLSRSEQAGKRILVSDPISSRRLMGLLNLPAQLEIRNNDANATCAAQSKPLGLFADGWKSSDSPGNPSIGRVETRVLVGIRGRWLLGLYGPQSIGAGLDDASDKMLVRAKDEIILALTRFLDKVRESDFQDSQPMIRAVGYDLALMTNADAAADGFTEPSVLTGGYRQPKTNDFQLDPEGGRRLDDFLNGPSSSGSAAELQQVGEKIRRYSNLFGQLSGESHPVAIYAGAAPSLRNLCSNWKDMTHGVAGLSGMPRVFGIVFANASAGQIDDQLERAGRSAPKNLGPRVQGLTCKGENGSMLLVVSFPDLISRTPETVLKSAYDAIQDWVASN